METLKPGFALGCLVGGVLISIAAKGAYLYCSEMYVLWERDRAWSRISEELTGKSFELDTRGAKVKNFETMSHEDLIRALYVQQIRIQQKNDVLESLASLISDYSMKDIAEGRGTYENVTSPP